MTPPCLSSTAEYNFLRVTFKTNTMSFKFKYNTMSLKHNKTQIQTYVYIVYYTMSLKYCRKYSPLRVSMTFKTNYNAIQIQAQTQRHSNTNTNTHVQNTEKTLLSACPWPLKPITLFVSSALCFRGKKFSSIKGTFNPHLEEKLPEIIKMFRHIWNCLELVLLKSSSCGFKRRCRQ